MTKLDRFDVGLKDPQTLPNPVVAMCPGCSTEIHLNDEVYLLDDGTMLHADMECVLKHFYIKEVGAWEVVDSE